MLIGNLKWLPPQGLVLIYVHMEIWIKSWIPEIDWIHKYSFRLSFHFLCGSEIQVSWLYMEIWIKSSISKTSNLFERKHAWITMWAIQTQVSLWLYLIFFLLKSIDIHQTTMNKYFAENHLNYKKKTHKSWSCLLLTHAVLDHVYCWHMQY